MEAPNRRRIGGSQYGKYGACGPATCPRPSALPRGQCWRIRSTAATSLCQFVLLSAQRQPTPAAIVVARIESSVHECKQRCYVDGNDNIPNVVVRLLTAHHQKCQLKWSRKTKITNTKYSNKTISLFLSRLFLYTHWTRVLYINIRSQLSNGLFFFFL